MNANKNGFQSLADIFSDKLNSNNKIGIDDKEMDDVLKSIEKSLLMGDVNARMARQLTNTVRQELQKRASEYSAFQKTHKINLVKYEIVKALTEMISPSSLKNDKRWIPSKYKEVGKTSIVIFCGLQGAGKTTSVMRYAKWYKKKGFNVGCICADTFRAGAYDQLEQNCLKIQVPYYGAYSASEPPEYIIQQGIERFSNDSKAFDMIIIDTAGRHQQADDLKAELERIYKSVKVDHSIFVMNASIGQQITKQVTYFKQFGIDSIILTCMDNTNLKGGGALAAVAVTNSPVIFIGIGEDPDDFEEFEAKSYITRLLGMGDMNRLFQKIKDAEDENANSSAATRIAQKFVGGGKKNTSKFTFEDFKDLNYYINNIAGNKVSRIVELIPGFQEVVKQSNSGTTGTNADMEFSKKLKTATVLFDSMNNNELCSDDKLFAREPTRIIRIVVGSGRTEKEFKEMIKLFGLLKKTIEKMKDMPSNINMNEMSEEDMMNMAMNMLPQNLRGARGQQSQMKNMLRSKIKGIM